MNSNELRIGNWVLLTKDGFKTTKPYELDGFDIYKLSESDCADIAPIPLTEDILLKCGFVYIQSLNGYYYKNITDEDFFIGFEIIEGASNLHIVSDQDRNVTKNCFPHIQYVHQLQNLFYFLSGKELIINL